MSLYQLAFLFLAAFLIHEFEEIVMVEVWVRRHPHARSLFNGYAGISTATIATVILLVIEVVAGLIALSISINQIGIFDGVVAVVTIHFFAHIGDSIRNRGYTPGVLWSILLAPVGGYILYVLETTYTHANSDNLVTVVTIVCMGPLFLSIRSLVPAIQARLEKYAH